MNKEEALKEGLVSKITPTITALQQHLVIIDQKLPDELSNYPQEISTAYKTTLFIRNNLTRRPENNDFKMKHFRTRSIDDLITQGYYPCCSDIGLLFRTLMIAQGIPTSYLETFHEKLYLQGKNNGHIYARIFTNTGEFIFDPTNPRREENSIAIYNEEKDVFFTDRCVVVAEGRDHADFGIHGWESWKSFKKEQQARTVKKYEGLLDWDHQTRKQAINELTNPATRATPRA